MPKVSVIIGCYNHADYIEEAIEGICAQTMQDFELIILDDASKDTSAHRIEQYLGDTRIHFVQNPRTLGISATYNIGFSMAQGEYIALQGGDDISFPERLEVQSRLLDTKPSVGAVFSLVHAINDKKERVPESEHIFEKRNATREEFLAHFFNYGNMLNAASEMIRASLLKKIGLYLVSEFQLQDFDMHIRTCIEQDIHIIQEPLLYYRVRDDGANVSANTLANARRSFIEHDFIYNNFLRITDTELLKKIFGKKIQRYGVVSKATIPYFIARLAMEHTNAGIKLWGFRTLYAFINQEGVMDVLRRDCGFTYANFLALEEKLSFLYS